MAKKTELHDGEQWVDITGEVADVTIHRGRSQEAAPDVVTTTLDNTDGKPEPEAGVSLHYLSAADALTQLRGARAAGVVALVDAPLGRPVDQAVVDDHAYSGERVGSAWHFAPSALDMACRVAGWSTVEWLSTDPAKLRLS